ncbi:MAG TPA: PhzF family phenazine biosynthesis protein [Noviherbaspirillum sp.]|nr:PhzF family phenazine biosynthesis protein [Noviherbaspirillum sp.]
MPREYTFRIVNVFAEEKFGGNPLCVFEDGRGLSDAEMQALARQFNLSETTFILPSECADARVRIFTPGYELPFAGHPTLGSAHVVRAAGDGGDAVSLEFKAGVVPVRAKGDLWSFTAPSLAAGAVPVYPPKEPRALIAALVGLNESDLAADPAWVHAGVDQLLIPVRDAGTVRRAAPDSSLLDRWPQSSLGRKTGYVFAFTGDAVLARYFFTTQGGGVSEDPGTGSACANLGAWMRHGGRQPPFSVRVSQGEAVQRPCVLYLDVNASGQISVGGTVRELGRGTITL